MKPIAEGVDLLLCLVRKNGWYVVLEHGQPALVRERKGAQPLLRTLVDQVKASRVHIIRHLIYVEILARSLGRPVWGYDSSEGDVRQPFHRKGVPENWDRICVEGDKTWTCMPKGMVVVKAKRKKTLEEEEEEIKLDLRYDLFTEAICED